ncbi:MAG: DCC1-like thiol-disulfide oxidoreductase family protein [Verrucomicrobiae bacterium]|nr:DCC1-like thiol-disulfide oxidoreductase family protein [Verrucomicrobiae bacterium]
MIRKIHILYDGECGFCRTCRDWILLQPRFFEIEMLDRRDPDTKARFGDYTVPPYTDRMVVINNEDGVYYAEDAYIMILFALKNYRAWSVRISRQGVKPLARQFFETLGKNRRVLSKLIHHT